MKFIYPPIKNLSPSPNTKYLTFEDILTNSNFSNGLGSFIIGKNKVFHGGINLSVPNGHGLQAVADGRIIAYRLSRKNQKITHQGRNNSTNELEFSNNFILIEHDFDQFKYLKFLEGGLVRSPYSGYKFYTLYMHMMPLDECNISAVLPDWLVLNKQKNTDSIPRGTKLAPDVPNFTKGFTVVNLVELNKTIKLSQNDIVKINNENFLNKKLDWYDSSTDLIKILDKFFITEDVVTLNDTTAIPVQAGELLGYAGKSHSNSIDQSQANLMHFEVWLDLANTNFLNNINLEEASYIPDSNSNSNVTAQKQALFNNLNIRSLGVAYIKVQRNRSIESLSFDMSDPSSLQINVRGLGDMSLIRGAATDFQNSILNNSITTLYTDADWLNNIVNPWKIYQQTDFFNNDGSIKEAEFRSQYSNPRVWKTLQDRAIVKLSYTEWDKQFFEQKYNFLVTKQSQYYTPLDQNTFQTLRQYQDAVSFLDKTVGSIVPAINDLHVVNPIKFLMQIKRCMLPAPPSANTHLVKRLVQYALDENVYLLEKLLKRMKLWIAGGSDRDLDTKFNIWFGYRQGVVSTTAATSIVYLDTNRTPPNVTDFNLARKIVHEYLSHALEVLKNLNYEKFSFGWGRETGAFVYPSDLNHNIHLGFQIYEQTAINNLGNVGTIENFQAPSFGRSNAGLGFISSLLHEAQHFLIKNSDIRDQTLVSNMYVYDRNYKFLSDIYVNYNDRRNTSIKFRAYGLRECQKLALDIPWAALCNSDSYAEFFANVMGTIRPNIQYRGI